MRALTRSLLDELGLRAGHSIWFDRQLHYALLAGPLFLAATSLISPDWTHGIAISLSLVISMVLWQPLIEELLFRGFLQGELNRHFHARAFLGKISVANCITTLLFCAVHVMHQSVALAAAVAVPSLLFGYFRERHQSIYSTIFLHAVYNALFLVVGR